MTEILTFIFTLTSFLLGYFLGARSLQTLTEVPEIIKKKLEVKSSPVGAVERPDAKKLYKWQNKAEAEEEEEMKKTIKKLMETK